MRLPAYLLVLMVTRHNIWGLVAADEQARVWNMLGATSMIGLLAVVWARCFSAAPAAVTAVCAWWAYEEMLVAGCSAWHLADPWVLGPGQELCSSRLGFRLGMFSLVAIGFLAAALLDELKRHRAPNNLTGK